MVVVVGQNALGFLRGLQFAPRVGKVWSVPYDMVDILGRSAFRHMRILTRLLTRMSFASRENIVGCVVVITPPDIIGLQICSGFSMSLFDGII